MIIVRNHRIWLPLLAALVMLTAAGWTGYAQAQELAITPQEGLEQLSKMGSRLGPGVTVVLKPGIYKGSASLSEVRGAPGRPVVITAEKGAVIESWKDKAKQEHLSASSLSLSKCSHIEIRGLDISGASRGITLGNCSNIVVRQNKIHDIGNYGIMSYFTTNVTIEENVIERSTFEHGIYISGDATNVRIAGNAIRDTHINGIHVNGVIVAPVLEKNTLERTGSYPTKEGGAGITFIGGVSAPVARENTLKAIYGQGITVEAKNAVIAANKFESYSWSAILALPGAQNLTITDNRFLDPTCIPLQLPSALLASLKATQNTYAVKDKRVFQDTQTQKVMTLDQWKAAGKD